MIDGWLLLKYVDRAGGTEADDVGEPRLRAFYLTRAGFPAQVPDDLDDVGDTGRAEWVALGKQSAAGVDGNLPADIGRAFVDHAPGLALAAELEVLVVQQLSSSEAVVQLDHVEVFRANARLLVRLRRGVAGERVDVEHRRVARRVRVRSQNGRGHPHGVLRELLGLLRRHEDCRRRAVAFRTTHVQRVRPSDRTRVQHILKRRLDLVLGVRVIHGVFVVLHRNLRELLLSRAVLAHMLDAGLPEDAGHQARAHHALGAVLSRRPVSAQKAHLAYLFVADRHRHIVSARSDGHPRLAEGRGAGSAGVGDVDDGHAGGANLLHDPLADHGVRLIQVAADDDLDVLDRAAGILDGADRRLGRERDDILVRVAPELQHRGSNNSYVSHGVLLSAPRRQGEASLAPTCRPLP